MFKFRHNVYMAAILMAMLFSGCASRNTVSDSSKTDSGRAFASVNTPGGLVLRREARVKSQRMFTLINKTNVLVLEKGPKEKIKDSEDYWYKVKLGDNEGWVFGKYLSRPVPGDAETEYTYVTGPNNFAVSYLSLYHNGRFDLYLEIMEEKKTPVIIMSGKWSVTKGLITIAFDKKQKFCKPCDFTALFVKPEGGMWNENIRKINDSTYSFSKDLTQIAIWGNPCDLFR